MSDDPDFPTLPDFVGNTAPGDDTSDGVVHDAEAASVPDDVDVEIIDAATVAEEVRDIAEVPAAELVMTVSVHLMSAAAIKLGLGDTPDAEQERDLDEARKLITSLAGLVTAAAPEIGDIHARALRDGLRTLQLAFREASVVPDEPGKGPGEKWTGPVT